MTLILIALTAIVSIVAFNRQDIFSRLQFNAAQIYHRKEYYRLISHGFIHADWIHLAVNMFVLFSFGQAVEEYFSQLKTLGIIRYPHLVFLLLYLTGIIVSSLLTLYKERDNYYYNAVGASGAVSSVVFTGIFFAPLQNIYFFAVLPVPGIVFGILYLVYSHYMSRRSMDNINHDAHFIGAVFGFIFPVFLDFRLIEHFLNQLGIN